MALFSDLSCSDIPVLMTKIVPFNVSLKCYYITDIACRKTFWSSGSTTLSVLTARYRLSSSHELDDGAAGEIHHGGQLQAARPGPHGLDPPVASCCISSSRR